jgi:sn-glycerol 3-phosphate transport system ATP-binding protein
VDSGGVEATVVGNEYLGSDTLVACEVDQANDSRPAGAAPWRIVAKLPGRQQPAAGTRMRLGWDAQHEHRFDAASGLRV